MYIHPAWKHIGDTSTSLRNILKDNTHCFRCMIVPRILLTSCISYPFMQRSVICYWELVVWAFIPSGLGFGTSRTSEDFLSTCFPLSWFFTQSKLSDSQVPKLVLIPRKALGSIYRLSSSRCNSRSQLVLCSLKKYGSYLLPLPNGLWSNGRRPYLETYSTTHH
jgi:hypothetical protein